MRCRGVLNGHSTAHFYQVPISLKYHLTPNSLLTGQYWHSSHMRCRGVLNAHSTVHFYQVLISLKYYSTPRSLLMGIGILGIWGVDEC